MNSYSRNIRIRTCTTNRTAHHSKWIRARQGLWHGFANISRLNWDYSAPHDPSSGKYRVTVGHRPTTKNHHPWYSDWMRRATVVLMWHHLWSEPPCLALSGFVCWLASCLIGHSATRRWSSYAVWVHYKGAGCEKLCNTNVHMTKYV